jgi:CheY-like chemotaxis protein
MTTKRAWKVLLIDDDQEERCITRDRLSGTPEGEFGLTWASTYKVGLEALQDHAADAVLVDHHLGARDGLELMADAVAKGGRKAPLRSNAWAGCSRQKTSSPHEGGRP